MPLLTGSSAFASAGKEAMTPGYASSMHNKMAKEVAAHAQESNSDSGSAGEAGVQGRR